VQKLEQIKNGVLSMKDLTAKEKDVMQKEFLRAKNLHIIKMQEEQKQQLLKQQIEDKAKRAEKREEARRQEKEKQAELLNALIYGIDVPDKEKPVRVVEKKTGALARLCGI